MEVTRVLVADDELSIREILSDFLTLEGFQVHAVEDGALALDELRRHGYHVVLTDMKMPRMGGIELLEEIHKLGLPVLTIIMTGFGTVETAISAIRKGAYDYILKPFKIDEVIRVIQRGLDHKRLEQENLALREALSIYRISEAMAQSLQLDRILELIVDATIEEIQADMVTLLLRDPAAETFSERIRKFAGEGERRDGRVNLDELLAQFHADQPLIVHGPRAARFLASAVAAGPDDKRLVSFCSVPLRVRDRVVGALNAYSYTPGRTFTEGQRKMLAVLASRAAVSIENARLYEDLVRRNDDLAQANLSLEENFRTTLIGFAQALEEADRYTRGHSERVSFYASLTAEGLGFNEAEQAKVVQAGLMHDIGKIGIRYEKLNKPGKLTPEELAMFRTHPAKGKRILEPMPFMWELIPGAYCHHEHYDGAGYPAGTMGDNIPLTGRIVSVADTYDAMTSDRAYRRALPHASAIAELERCAGSQFDPRIVEAFCRKIEEHRRAKMAANEPVIR